MSFLKRIFSKRDDDGDGVPAKPPADEGTTEAAAAASEEIGDHQATAEAAGTTATETERSTPAAAVAQAAERPAAPMRKKRNESQTFQVQRPVAAPARKDDDSENGMERRRISIRTSEAAGEEGDELARERIPAANQDLRRSQTIRVDPPAAEAAKPPANPAIREDLRQSQTIRVRPPKTAEPAPEEPEDGPEMEADLGTIVAAVPEASGLDQQSREEDGETDDVGTDDEARETVDVPLAALLEGLPREHRGKSWQQAARPEGTFSLERHGLLEQLQSGRVTVELADIAAQIPAGWLSPEAAGAVELDISQVVPALPSEWLAVTAEAADDVVAAREIRNLFRPATDAESDESVTEEMSTVEADEDQVIEVPAAALLASLPPELRGPAWEDDRLAGSSLLVPKDALLEQLAAGSITVDTEDLTEQLPPGWIIDGASGDVELDLAAVVSALPADLFEAKGDMLQEVADSEAIGNLFGAHTAEAGTEAAAAESKPARRSAAAETIPETASDEQPATPKKTAALPLSSIANALPEESRGEAWNTAALPEGTYEIDTGELLRQLAAGRVVLSAGTLRTALPAGWIRDGAADVIELDLAAVVQALPPELMQVDADVAEDVKAAETIGVLFKSAEPVAEAPAEHAAAPAGTPDQVGESRAAAPPEQPLSDMKEDVKKTPAVPREEDAEKDLDEDEDEGSGRAWDGVEPSMEMAPLGIDINTARAAQLARLPSIGEVRAGDIIAYRDTHGPFETIFELAHVPGVGPSSFRKMTGFSIRRRTSRHDVLLDMLNLQDDGRPVLTRIAEALRDECKATGCLLTNQEGIPLSVSGEMPDATAYAALGSRYFFRTRRHLQRFVDKASDCIILPGSRPPLLLLARNDVVAIFTLAGGGVSSRRLSRLRRAMREIGWLLSRRAVVMNI